TVRRFVYPFNQVTSLLEFNRQKVSSRDVDALEINASLIGATGSDLIGPKSQTIRVGRSVEKIVIVLAHEVLRAVYHVRRLGGIVGDCHRGDRRCVQANTRGITQI